MAVEVRLPTVLRAHADGAASVDGRGGHRGRGVRRPRRRATRGSRASLIDDAGSLHKFVNVYRNDDDIRYLDRLDTKVADGDVDLDPPRRRRRLTARAGVARFDSILDLIGDTPLVGLHPLSPNPDVRICAKLEGQNPGGSVEGPHRAER